MDSNGGKTVVFDTDVADVVVIGAGPAGMAAAVAARRHGASVVLLDEQAAAGGQIYRGVEQAPPGRMTLLGPDYAHGAALAQALAGCGARHITGASVWQVTTGRQVNYLVDGRVQAIKAGRIILCTGAMERPFPIPGWTLPGVMTAGAAQILLKGAGMAPSQPVVLAGCGPLLYLLGWQYLRAGVKIAAIVETTRGADYRRALRFAGAALAGWSYLKKGLSLMSALRHAGVPFYRNASELHVLGADKTSGLGFVSQGRLHRIETALVLLHQGVVPNTQLTWSLRAAHTWDEAQLCWHPVTDAWGELDVEGIFVAGDGRGIGGATVAAMQGELAGLAVAAQLGKLPASQRDQLAVPLHADMRKHLGIRPLLDALYRPRPENRIPADDTIVCRCEEVSAGEIRAYVKLGCTGPNQVKSYGRCGMGPCQGRLCGLTVTEVIADARGVAPPEIGYYRIRPPIKPLTLGELAHEAK
ncbi:FAD-dependent oxidoreductase [Herbaspirillum sp. AP02]|uniref:FAD/NAD(P)-dependent oxidoreductase n=1 Tax=unclassified Herbaspirillum TaxID=2624150 RepID=UPI0015DA22D7|nr:MULTISPECIES: NAD(P)/FAD-dependent oxidoreductase [unclassified Herbaspirillum]MBG7621717.1 FAD-dependent oxidoreductase [Herbaspirillum sp. AP02]NZD67097.1 FAD-dependent oxidoreductase [Herbaspirillum sp. AP21]